MIDLEQRANSITQAFKGLTHVVDEDHEWVADEYLADLTLTDDQRHELAVDIVDFFRPLTHVVDSDSQEILRLLESTGN